MCFSWSSNTCRPCDRVHRKTSSEVILSPTAVSLFVWFGWFLKLEVCIYLQNAINAIPRRSRFCMSPGPKKKTISISRSLLYSKHCTRLCVGRVNFLMNTNYWGTYHFNFLFFFLFLYIFVIAQFIPSTIFHQIIFSKRIYWMVPLLLIWDLFYLFLS